MRSHDDALMILDDDTAPSRNHKLIADKLASIFVTLEFSAVERDSLKGSRGVLDFQVHLSNG